MSTSNLSVTISPSTTASILWNGPTCQTCGARYLGSHKCSQADLVNRVNELLALLGQAPPAQANSGCPCRKENGGSGVCGCILGGPQVS